jgi:putative transposase
MKRSKFSESQVAFILRQAQEGTLIGEVCRKAGISEATFYVRRKKYGGLMPSEMRRLKQLEDENSRLKRIVADLSLDKEMLQDVIRRPEGRRSQKCRACPAPPAPITCEWLGRSVSGAPARRSRRNGRVTTTRASGPIRRI